MAEWQKRVEKVCRSIARMSAVVSLRISGRGVNSVMVVAGELQLCGQMS